MPGPPMVHLMWTTALPMAAWTPSQRVRTVRVTGLLTAIVTMGATPGRHLVEQVAQVHLVGQAVYDAAASGGVGSDVPVGMPLLVAGLPRGSVPRITVGASAMASPMCCTTPWMTPCICWRRGRGTLGITVTSSLLCRTSLRVLATRSLMRYAPGRFMCGTRARCCGRVFRSRVNVNPSCWLGYAARGQLQREN